MRKTWRIAATVLFFLALTVGATVGDRLLALSNDARDHIRIYTELVQVAHASYGEEVQYKDLVFASIEGLVRSLDPHTSFLGPRAYTGMREKQAESFFGLGILVSMRNGLLTVITPIEGTPASRLGIRAGDVISSIEGEPTDTMSVDDAVSRLKGPKDTQVNIEISRRGLPEPIKMTVTRAEIPQTTVRYAHLLDDKTGYIWLTDFNRSSGREMADAIRDLKAAGMERLIFDLRNNGGGLLDQAIEIADQFVPRNSMIVETRGRDQREIQPFLANSAGSDLDLPVVVLVNRGTASAAEIVSGAVQDHDMGIIVGTPTWGKGLVQTVYTLSYGAGLALTTAKYYTPAGRLIQRDYSDYYDYVTADTPEFLAEFQRAKDGDPSHPLFYTDLGREVYGGGGITPDYVVEPDTLTTFEQFLLARNAFVNFAVDYTESHKEIAPDWYPSADTLASFESWLVDEEIASEQEVVEALGKEGKTPSEPGSYLSTMIRSEVLHLRYGKEAQQRAIAEGDKVIQEALRLFDRASELLAQRESLERAPRVERTIALD
jgi:carboxyl-terminal processing protease